MATQREISVQIRGVLAQLFSCNFLLFYGFLLWTSTTTLYAAGNEITWALYNAAPYMMTDGPDIDQGIFDDIRHLITSTLVEYKHLYTSAPFVRTLTAKKYREEQCVVCAVQTAERNNYAYFSLPVALFYPLSIVVNKADVSRLELKAPLSLANLLSNRTLKTSILRTRSLGPVVDKMLQDYQTDQAHSDFDESYKMLLAGRLDYLIEYPLMAFYSAKRLGRAGDLASLPFDEAPRPIFSRVMCSKTDWGRTIIDRINSMLRVRRPTIEYRRIVEKWSSERDVEEIRRLYDSDFLQAE